MAIRDSALVIRVTSDGAANGTASEGFFPAAGLDIEGTALNGMCLHMIIPACDSSITAGALKVTVYANSASTFAEASDGVIISQRNGITAAGEYVIPFSTKLRCVAFGFSVTTAASGAASGGWTAITAAHVTLPFNQDFTRTVEWH